MATVTTRTWHTPDGAANETAGEETNADVGDSDGTGSGTADANGSSATSKNPNQEGGNDETEERWDIPGTSTFSRARITARRPCESQTTPSISVTCEGNVSVSGGVDASEVWCTQVHSTTGANGKVTTKTKTKRKSCA